MPSNKLLEVKFSARAGQGAKTAAQIVAEAGLKNNFFVQAFPQYGPERRGAPVSTFVRLSTSPILTHAQIKKPDIVAVIEPGLEEYPEASVKVINTKEASVDSSKTWLLDATQIAEFFLGRNLPNIVMVGALLKVIESIYPVYEIPIESASETIRESLGEKWGEELVSKNISALEAGYKEVKQDEN
ncbi:MAG: 2-oxoacid:acceptor oxidoreductase family protein [Patescibacteria group bacterium]